MEKKLQRGGVTSTLKFALVPKQLSWYIMENIWMAVQDIVKWNSKMRDGKNEVDIQKFGEFKNR